MPKVIHAPSAIGKVYERIPEKDRKEILESKEGVMNANGDKIRMQFFIPNEIYVVLKYYNALENGEGDFFTKRAVLYILNTFPELFSNGDKR